MRNIIFFDGAIDWLIDWLRVLRSKMDSTTYKESRGSLVDKPSRFLITSANFVFWVGTLLLEGMRTHQHYIRLSVIVVFIKQRAIWIRKMEDTGTRRASFYTYNYCSPPPSKIKDGTRHTSITPMLSPIVQTVDNKKLPSCYTKSASTGRQRSVGNELASQSSNWVSISTP